MVLASITPAYQSRRIHSHSMKVRDGRTQASYEVGKATAIQQVRRTQSSSRIPHSE